MKALVSIIVTMALVVFTHHGQAQGAQKKYQAKAPVTQTAKTGLLVRMPVMDNEKTCRYENMKLILHAQRKILAMAGGK